ncbi:MAG: hypothetical protein ACKOWF_06790 [Chloroflexota bacterium]
MDRQSVLMIRASLAWLAAAGALGAALMAAAPIGLPGGRALALIHVHALLVGWLVQFALGVGYWLFPRRRGPGRPLGYRERTAAAAFVALNAGLLLRVVVEPAMWGGAPGTPARWLATIASLAQGAAILTFARQLWPRVAARLPKP